METRQAAPSDIDEYIAGFPKETQEILQQVRMTIRQAVPEAQETIKYGMPTFTLHKNLVYFAAAKKHLGLYGASSTVLEAFKDELAGNVGPKGALAFPYAKPIPYELIGRLVELLAQEQVKRAEAKEKQKH